ncbi:MAG: hypothetical protein AAGI53_13810 [Planctomycetota bacterium]
MPCAAAFNCTSSSNSAPSVVDRLIGSVTTVLTGLRINVSLTGLRNVILNDTDDEWDTVLSRIIDSDIIVLGGRASVGHPDDLCLRLLDRLEAAPLDEDTKQPPLYGKVACLVLAGPEADCRAVYSSKVIRLTHLGATIPPDSSLLADSEGERHVGLSSIERDAQTAAMFAAHNLAWFCRLLRDNPVPTNLGMLAEQARHGSALAFADAIRD